MRHRKSGRKLNRTSSHRKALMRNMATELLRHKKIHTTLAKAKELRPYAERIITRAKQALEREQLKQLPAGHAIDIHARRIVYKDIQDKKVLEELFDAIAPTVASRPGGYCRIVKIGTRRGDAGEMAIIELVDWGTQQENTKKRKKPAKAKTTKKVEKVEEVVAEPVAVVDEVEEIATVEVQEEVAVVVETPVDTETVVVDETPVAADAVDTTSEETTPEANNAETSEEEPKA